MRLAEFCSVNKIQSPMALVRDRYPSLLLHYIEYPCEGRSKISSDCQDAFDTGEELILVGKIGQHTRSTSSDELLFLHAGSDSQKRNTDFVAGLHIPHAVTDVDHPGKLLTARTSRSRKRQLDDRVSLRRVIGGSRWIVVVAHAGARHLNAGRIGPAACG